MLDSGVRLAAAFLPVGVPVIVGLVLAVLRRRSLPTVTGPAILGLALQLVVVIITTFLVAAASLQAFGLTPETLLPLSSALGFVVIVLQVLSWTLLLIALFRRLPTSTEPATAAAPMPVPAMEQDRTPTGRHALLDDRGAQVVAEEGTTFLPVGGPRPEPPPSSMPLPSMPLPGPGRPGPGTPARGYPAMGHPGPGRPMPGPPPAPPVEEPTVEETSAEEPAVTETFAAGSVPPVQDEPAAPDDERSPGSLQDAPGEGEAAEDTEYPGYLDGVDEQPSDTGSNAAEQEEVPETTVFAAADPAEPADGSDERPAEEDDVVADEATAEDTVEEQAEDEDPAQDPAVDEAVAEDPSEDPDDDVRDDPTATDGVSEPAEEPVTAGAATSAAATSGAATSAAAPTPGHYLGTPQRPQTPQTPAPAQAQQTPTPPQSPEPPASRGGHPWFDPDGDAARRAAEHAQQAQQTAQAEPVEQAGPPHASSTEGR